MNSEQDKRFLQAFIEKISYTDTTLEEWILKYVYVKGNVKYSFDGYAFWQDVVRKSSNHPYLVFLKAAQIGYSTLALARLFWKLIRSNYKAGIYFPTDQAMRDFAQERVYPFIDNCPIVKQELSQSAVDNVRVKQFGNAYLILRGTWKKSNVKSVDLDIVMLDEVDEHNKENIEFVGDRLLASKLNWMMLGSQPSMHNTGIHAEFLTTDQHYWLIKCSKCNHWNNLVESIQQDFESIFLLKDENVYYKCLKCGNKLNNQKGEYVAKTKSDKRGYQISQLFTQLDPKVIYRKYKDANTSAKRKNFWISYIGLPYETDEEKFIAVLDKKTSLICQGLHLKTVELKTVNTYIKQFLADDPERAGFWEDRKNPPETALREWGIEKLSGDEILARLGHKAPPFHPHCRTTLVASFDVTARTIKEAEERAKSMGVEAHYGDEKNLKLANYINQNLRFFQDRGYRLVEKVVISKEAFLNKEDLIAFYRHKDKGIYFQPNIKATENIKEYLEKRKKAYSTTNENHFFRHEFGHFYFHSLDESKYQKLRMSKFRERNQNKIEKLVSKSATRNVSEFLSEVFAGIIEKKEYPKVIMRLYYKYGGR